MHKTIYEEQLIPQDVMTQLGELVPNFATGQHTYMVVHEYDQKVFNTPVDVADRRRLPQRDHAGQDALDLHLDRGLPDGRRSDRRPIGSGT